jgi:hypothetical protein
MVSIIKTDIIKNKEEGKLVVGQYVGLSTDDKPTENIGNGSIFIEIDTKKIYFYDEENSTWREF